MAKISFEKVIMPAPENSYQGKVLIEREFLEKVEIIKNKNVYLLKIDGKRYGNVKLTSIGFARKEK